MSTTIHSKYRVLARLSTETDYTLPFAIFEHENELTDQNTKFRRMLIVSALPTQVETYTIWKSVTALIVSNTTGTADDEVLMAYISTVRPDTTDPLWPQINFVVLTVGQQVVIPDFDPRWNLYFLGGLVSDRFVDLAFVGTELETYIAP